MLNSKLIDLNGVMGVAFPLACDRDEEFYNIYRKLYKTAEFIATTFAW